MREGRTDSVRPRLADRLAAKDKTLSRVLDGNSAHPRTPGACCAWLQTKRPRAHFSFRRCFQVYVTLRQPKVTAQLPTGGDVSPLKPMRSSAGFGWPCRGRPLRVLTSSSSGPATYSNDPRSGLGVDLQSALDPKLLPALSLHIGFCLLRILSRRSDKC